MTEVKIVETTEIVDQPLPGGLSRQLRIRVHQLIDSASGKLIPTGSYELTQDGHHPATHVGIQSVVR